MKRILSLIIAAVVIAMGGYWLVVKPQISTLQDSVQKLEPLRVFPGPGPAASLFQIAQQKMFFGEEGLDVTLQNYETGPESISALQEDKLDVAHPAEFAFVTNTFKEKNQNLKILGSVVRWAGIEIVARKDHGIEKPTDIAGKRIGLAMETQSEFALADFLSQNQISFDQVILIDIQSREKGVSALLNGDVDAIVSVNQFVYESKRELGNNAISWWLQDDFLSFPLLVTTQEKIEKNPEVYEKLLRALEKAVDYANAHPEETKKTGMEAYGFKKDFLDFYWQRIRFEMSLPQELLLVMENQARWLIDKNLVQATRVPNYLNYIYPNALERIKPEAVTIIK